MLFVTPSNKFNIESEHINVVNRTKSCHNSALIFLYIHQYLDKKAQTSFPEWARSARTTSWLC